jgi:pimeloyl-ACP methyl ester carboxylesterase
MLWRRIPLALHAYANVAARYRLDPDRIYVSGFSGGSRTALRVALAYPDVFRAAVLNAGADPFGEPGFPLPPPELFRLFQERSRLITISGTDDANIVARDAALSDSARRWCVVGIERQPMLQTGHEMMRASMLDHAIDAIERPESDASRHAQALAACRARVDAEMAKALDEVRILLAQGKRKLAGEALSKIDGTYSGLAAPALRELAQPFIAK